MHKQNGFVSIIATSFIMVILSVMVIAFTAASQREQRQAIDRQLSTQALNAADTALNDVYQKLLDNTLPEEKTTCDVADWPETGLNGVLDPAYPDIRYTCLKYDKTPPSIRFDNGGIKTQSSKTFPMQSKTSTPFRSIKIEWSGARDENEYTFPSSTNCATTPLPADQSSPGIPILRIDLVPLPIGSVIDREDVYRNTQHFFLYPKDCPSSNNNISINYSDLAEDCTDDTQPCDKGQIIPVNCNSSAKTTGYACEFTILSVDSGVLIDRFFNRIKSIYNDANVNITAIDNNNDIVEFANAQVAVDSTAKSNDVLRRIEARLGLPNYAYNEFVVQGMDGICKSLSIQPPDTIYDPDNCL